MGMNRLHALRLAILAWSLALWGGTAAGDQPGGTNNTPELWLEAKLSPSAPYVQSQSLYTVRLYQAIGLRDLEFRAPAAPLAEIRPIGERIEELTHAGRRYRVTERRYAVLPFASGELALEPAGISAHRGSTPPAAPDIVLDAPRIKPGVRPIPPGAPAGAWLPAHALELAESWSADPATLAAGQPIQRTIRISARGTDASQLPELQVRGDGITAYPAPPALHNRIEGDWNIGVREQTWTMVPARPGAVTVSETRIAWWNVGTHRAEVARLPERSLSIAAAPSRTPDGASGSPIPDSAPSPTPPAPPPSTAGIEHAHAPFGIEPSTAATYLLVIAFAGGLCVALRRRTTAWLRFAHACLCGDARAARSALLQLEAPRPPAAVPKTLGELAFYAPNDCQYRKELARLEQHCYGPHHDTWRNGIALAGSLVMCKLRRRWNKRGQPQPSEHGRRITASRDGRHATRRR